MSDTDYRVSFLHSIDPIPLTPFPSRGRGRGTKGVRLTNKVIVDSQHIEA